MTRGLNCGVCKNHCCGQSGVNAPIVLPSEIKNYKKEDIFVKDGVTYIKRKEDGLCKFLNENKQCTIYEKRPLECRLYPWIMRFDGNGVSLELHDGCEQKDRVNPFNITDIDFWKKFDKLPV